MPFHRHRVRVRFTETECTGVVNFINYGRWMDEALLDGLTERGLSYDRFGNLYLNGKKLDGVFMLGEYRVRMEKPSKLLDYIDVEITVDEMREKVVVFGALFKDASTGETLAKGSLTYVYVDVKLWKAASIPKELKELIVG
ncbi:MAG TPA: hypothetical protein EYH45_06960 [Candidatus Caldiarchaeum subterraneum]|uniref:Acyl-CoA thioesterase n=1 Tax=Caldiarchaeum subterraneum TaxID=311458 RepID=A0A833EA94_CALS0|nr:hypothetical protein [Aigarchaeota archaeon]HIQ30287.1 hypothetical protein [Candidatus Caldarchaeum subterraneum]